ncbi:hypothetical protein FRC03_007051 [Tulasnella sp. 419]|nr:hypothetical protein FRC03_007051 [Tulasnella sp. 419]
MEDYVAKLLGQNRLIKKLHSDCRLANILAGNTCAPISLEEFELYLAYREVSLENLQFVVWFLDYQNRWAKLPEHLRAACPDPALFANPDTHPRFSPRASTVNDGHGFGQQLDSARLSSLKQKIVAPFRRSDSVHHIELQHTSSPTTSSGTSTSRSKYSYNFDHSISLSPTTPLSKRSHSLSSPLLQPPPRSASSTKSKYFPLSPLSLSPTSPFSQKSPYSPTTPPCTTISPSDQPFRDETIRIVATFMRTGGTKKELALEEELREQVLRNLAFTTHPNVFLPVYRQIYEQLEMSVQNFLTAASANVNLPKQLYWYAVGLFNIILSIIMASLIIALVHTSKSNPNIYARAWRLFSVPFGGLGGMQFYSGYRGFCSQVYGRSSIQLKAWELEEPEEVGVKWRKKKKYRKVDRRAIMTSDSTTGGSEKLPDLEAGEKAATGHNVEDQDSSSVSKKTLPGNGGTPHDPSLIAPFAFSNLSLHGETVASQDEHGTDIEDHNLPTTTSTTDLKDGAADDIVQHGSSKVAQNRAGFSNEPTHEIALVKPKRRAIGLSRPPVFGPEKVVMDARIRRYHESVLTDMAWFGFYWTTVFTVIIMCIPGPKT